MFMSASLDGTDDPANVAGVSVHVPTPRTLFHGMNIAAPWIVWMSVGVGKPEAALSNCVQPSR